MSATINYSIFSKYFNDAPLLKIPGFTHPVTDMFVVLVFIFAVLIFEY